LLVREKPVDDVHRYACLEKGARHLASVAKTETERLGHLSWANRYHRWQVDAAESAGVAAASLQQLASA
jgi:hypothetical protein